MHNYYSGYSGVAGFSEGGLAFGLDREKNVISSNFSWQAKHGPHLLNRYIYTQGEVWPQKSRKNWKCIGTH